MMAKKKGAAKRRRRKAQQGAKHAPKAMLEAVAAALNACENAGMEVRIIPGPIIITDKGMILPPWKDGKKDKGWDVRPAGRSSKLSRDDSHKGV
jgi:hypothetical protein